MGSEKKSLADIDYLVAKHGREEKLPENRLKQISLSENGSPSLKKTRTGMCRRSQICELL